MASNKGIVLLPDACLKAFTAALEDSTRIMKFSVNVESLEFVLLATVPKKGSVDSDFASIASLLEEEVPCLVIFKLEPKWMLVAWVPDDCEVRKKMIFAQSRASLKNALGASKFEPDYFITTKDEVKFSLYKASTDESAKEATKTLDEKAAESEAKVSHVGAAVKSKALGMLDLKIDDSAGKALADVQSGKRFATVLTVSDKEELKADSVAWDSITKIREALDPEQPCYVLLKFSHKDPKGADLEKFILVYFCSDDAHPRKKMLYSTVASNITAACEAFGVEIAKRIEISLVEEFSETEFHTNLYPPVIEKAKFDKPKGPPRRGKK